MRLMKSIRQWVTAVINEKTGPATERKMDLQDRVGRGVGGGGWKRRGGGVAGGDELVGVLSQVKQ